jgi:sulfur-carrier protein
MTITVQIPTALRRHTSGTGSLVCSATNLGELFTVLDQNFPDLKPHLRDESGQVRRFLNVYVNEEDIRFLGGDSYAFKEGDEVLLVPSIAGGSQSAEQHGTMELRSESWWTWSGSNRRPLPCHGSALPAAPQAHS